MRHHRPQGLSLNGVVAHYAADFRTITDTGCWELWGVAASKLGYTTIWFDKRMVPSHRLFYMAYVGPIPEGMSVCHKCDNPRCVNPDHLFVGTSQDNTDDMMNKGRKVTRRGSFVNKSNLTDENVIAIRERVAAGEMHTELAKEYGVNNRTISNIALGKYWKHVGGPITQTGRGTHRGLVGNFPVGEKCHASRLTEDDIREIRRAYAVDNVTLQQLGDRYGITIGAVSKIIHRKNWKHVD